MFRSWARSSIVKSVVGGYRVEVSHLEHDPLWGEIHGELEKVLLLRRKQA